MPNVTINNFPPNGSTGEMRTLMFGPTGPMRVLIDVDSEGGEDFNVDLTISNAAEHSEIKAYLTDVIELLQVIVEGSHLEAEVEQALEQKRAERFDYVDEDEFFDEDED